MGPARDGRPAPRRTKRAPGAPLVRPLREERDDTALGWQQPQQQQAAGRAMLSRIAELVYWIGRFIERAEGVSKMVASYHYSAHAARLARGQIRASTT